MSFNRLRYDVCSYKEAEEASEGPGRYMMQTPQTCNCYEGNPSIRLQKQGGQFSKDFNNRFYAGPVDIDSELKNLNRSLSDCQVKKYNPKCDTDGNCMTQGGNDNQNNFVNPSDCFFPNENTRLSNPPCTLRGTGWNRFEPLCMNPQDRVLFEGEYNVPNRLVVKDNHRPCVSTPAVNNMLPPPKDIPCPGIKETCGAFTDPLYVHGKCN